MPPADTFTANSRLGLDARARLQAAGTHLALSALVAAAVAALVFVLWYPMPFREISGGRELFWIVIAVDVALGPLITLAVYDRRKPAAELRRDVAVVVLLQLAGLAYGLHAVSLARPVVLALEGDRLRVVRAVDLDDEQLAKAPPDLRERRWWGIDVVATRKPTADEKFDAIQLALQGVDIGMRPEFWLPPASAPTAMAREAKPLTALAARYPARRAELQGQVLRTGVPPERLGYLPVVARQADWVALVDRGDGRIVGYAPFDGF